MLLLKPGLVVFYPAIQLCSRKSFYWHDAGLGDDAQSHPADDLAELGLLTSE